MIKSNVHDTVKCDALFTFIESGIDDNVWPIYNEKVLNISKNCSENTYGDLKKRFLFYYSTALSNKGFTFLSSGDSKTAEKYYVQALQIQRQQNFEEGIASSLVNIGYLSKQEGDILKALDYYHKSLSIQLKLKNINGAATLYNNIAFIFNSQGEYTQALNYYQKAASMHRQMKDLSGLSTVLINISNIYSKKGSLFFKGTTEEANLTGRKIALNYIKRAIKIEDSLDIKIDLAGSLNVLGCFYDEYGDLDYPNETGSIENRKRKTLDLFERALKIRLETKYKPGIILSYLSLSKHMLSIKNFNKALLYAQQAFELSNEIGTIEYTENATEILSKVYKQLKDYEKSLKMKEIFIQLRDSLNNNNTKRAVIQKGFQIEYERKAAADSVKVAEEKKLTSLQLKQEESQRYFLYAGLLLTLIFGAFMFNRFRIIKKQKNIIEEQKTIVEKQKHIVDEKQKEVMDSIHYAKRIQQSLLPTEKYLERNLKH